VSSWSRRIALIALIPLAIALTAMPAQAKKGKSLPWPRHFKSVVASTGTPGQVTISWKPKGKKGHTKTKTIKIETGLTQFSPYTKKLPTHGRHSHVFYVKWKGKGAGHLTLGAKQLAAAGASVGSGNTVYYRIWSINKKGKKRHVRTDGKLRTFVPRGYAPSGSQTVTIGSYNVRSAGLDLGNSHNWYKGRGAQVAKNIAGSKPGIMLIQEALPGPQGGNPSQLQDLVKKVNADVGGDGTANPYTAVRYGYYDPASDGSKYYGTQQGMRILYDTKRYAMIGNCSDGVGVPQGRVPATMHDNSSCSIKLPVASGDSVKKTRWAAYAEFQAKDSTGKLVGRPFWVVSVHLDERTGAKYNALKLAQMKAITAYMNKIRGGAPVILGGDFNDFQNDQTGYGNSAHDYLVSSGWYDTAAAYSQYNLKYPTINHFQTSKVGANGAGVRMDMILTEGVRGANSFLIKTNAGSDHNMIVATTKLP